MGWRDRDWAKLTDEEFAAIYGGSKRMCGSSAGRGSRPLGGRGRRSERFAPLRQVFKPIAISIAGAVALVGVVIVRHEGRTGQTASTTPPLSIGPAVAAPVPPRVSVNKPAITRISGTRLLRQRGSFTLSGRHTPMSGSITIRGRWDAGPWATFAVADAARTTYSLRIPLLRIGVLHLEVRYPDGSRAVGTYHVE